MPRDFEAVIIGAGPAGSTAAILLAQAGWSVALVEKQPFPRRKVCGECIAASNLPLLDALGVGEAFAAVAGPPLRRVALECADGAISADLPRSARPRHAWGRALGRELLDGLLLERARAAGATVLQPWSVCSIDGEPGNLRCELAPAGTGRPRRLYCSMIIRAHGSWQPLPQERVHALRTRRPGELLAFKANFRNARLEEGLLPVLSFRGGYGGLVVADRALATLACCIRADRLAACRRAAPGQRAGATVEAYLKRQCAGVRAALDGASLEGPWIATGPIRPGVHLPAGAARTYRIGNAAGEAHPIIGEGISMALQSAWLLCEQLLSDRRALLLGAHAGAHQGQHQRHYAQRWRAQFAARLRLASVFANLAMRPQLAAPLVALLRRFPMLLTQGACWSGKIDCAIDVRPLHALAPPGVAGAGHEWPAQQPASPRH